MQRARAARLDGAIRFAVGDTSRTATILVEAARAMEPFDPHIARHTMLEALAAARVTGAFTAPGETEIDVSVAARAMRIPEDTSPTIGDLLLEGDIALFLDDHATAAPLLRDAIGALESDQTDSDEMLWWLAIGCWAAGALSDDGAMDRLARRLEQTARERGAVVPLSIGLFYVGLAELFAGELSASRAHLVERAELMAAIGGASDIGRLVVLAWSGHEHDTRAEAAALTVHATTVRHGWILHWVDYALTVLELGLGNYGPAFENASSDYQANCFLSTVAFPDLIEAAVRSDHVGAAEQALAEFASRAEVNDTPLSLGLLARARALLADDSDAESHYLRSIDDLSRVRGAVHLARSQLLYGEWLRRQKRRHDAAEQLHAAYRVFDVVGATSFAARARGELGACGERARRRRLDTVLELTPQEERVANLAAAGATNMEIASNLFISSSTVDYHLRKVYRKLDVTSRRQLSSALDMRAR